MSRRLSLWVFVAGLAIGPAAVLSLPPSPELKPGATTNWARWRGPTENGHTADKNLPVKWGDADVTLKVSLPGNGQSTPIVWGERIFLTSALELGKSRLMFCVDRNDGKILWQHTAWTGEPEPTHKMNGWASASCVTDGEIVAAFFGRGGGLHVYTVDGKHLWSKDLGQFDSPWGVSSCPILVDDMIVQNCDADVGAYITALDKQTGKEIWKTKRPDNRGWSTPIVTTLGGRRELVVNGHSGVFAYDPATGKELWFCSSSRGRGEATVTPIGDLLCVVNGQGGCYAVKPGGDGDVSATHRQWEATRKGRDTPSPIVFGDYVLIHDLAGFISCYNAKSGELYYKERVLSNASASPIAANGLAYFLNEAGKAFIIEPAATLKIVAENELTVADDEIFRATITPSDGQLLIRSTKVLYIVGKRKAS